MARIFPPAIGTRPQGSLHLEKAKGEGFSEIYYIPPVEILKAVGITSTPERNKKKILEVFMQGEDNWVTIYPTNTFPKKGEFLKEKYSTLSAITLMGFDLGSGATVDDVVEILEGLPNCFVKDYNYGLGFTKEFRFIPYALEGLNIKDLIILNQGKDAITSIFEHTYTINLPEFNSLCRALNKTRNEARKTVAELNAIIAHNYLSYFLQDEEKYPQKDARRNSLLNRPISGLTKIPDDSAEGFVKKVKLHAEKVSKEEPQALWQLKNDIELISLDALILKFEEMLKKDLPEKRWQKLFSENPFILSMAFGFPVVHFQGQTSVGGKKLSGGGDKVTDFLFKNGLSNNIGLFEIKTPSTKMLTKKEYREGVFAPSGDLSGALNQLLDQKYQLEKNIVSKKEASRVYDLETYAVQGVLVIGRMPADKDRQKSFEIFRGNSKNVFVITFDELLEKLKSLRNFLSPGQENSEDNIPF